MNKIIKFLCQSIFFFFVVITSTNCNNKESDLKPFTSKPSKELVEFVKELVVEDSAAFYKSFNKAEYSAERDSIIRSYLTNLGVKAPTLEYLSLLKKYDAVRAPISNSKAFLIEEQALCYLKLAKLDSAEILGNKALQLYKEINNKQGIARVSNLIAGVYGYMSKFSKSLKLQNEAYQIFESLNDSVGIYNTLMEIGHSFFGMEKYEDAKRNFEKSYAFYASQKDTLNMSDVLCSIGSVYHQVGNQNAFEDATYKALNLKEKIGDKKGLALCYNSLGVSFMTKKKWEEAKTTIISAKDIFHSLSEYREEVTMFYNLGVCEMELGNYNAAIKIFEEGISYAKNSQMRDDGIMRIYERLYLLYQKQGDFKHSLQNYHSFVEMRDSIFTIQNNELVNELNMKFGLKDKENKILKLSEEKKVFQLQQILLIVLIGAILLISGLLFWFQRIKNQKTKILFEAEKMLKQNQLETALKEIEFNKTILSDFTSNIIERNIVISELESKLTFASNESPQNSVESESMFSLVQSKLLTDQDWTKFKMLFEKAFPEFITRLRNTYPDLTSAEERIFLLLKVKNDTKEMADALGISVESVRKGKYRLKKKLNLQEETILDDFIKNF